MGVWDWDVGLTNTKSIVQQQPGYKEIFIFKGTKYLIFDNILFNVPVNAIIEKIDHKTYQQWFGINTGPSFLSDTPPKIRVAQGVN